jgi:uncharacterized protein (TIGR00106 family)
MVVNFEVIPLGVGTSTSPYLGEILKMVDDSRLDYRLTAMGTVVEGEWDEVMGLIRRCHHKVLSQVDRVITHVTIDDRKGYTGCIEGKVRSVEEKAGRTLRK